MRRIDPNGRIRTVVGGSGPGFGGDGFPAALGRIKAPQALALGDDGSLFIADLGNGRIRKVDENGTLTTVAGGGVRVGARVSAKSAELSQPTGVTTGPDGATWITDASAGRVYRLRSPLPEGNLGDVVLPSEDGASAYVFDENGRHLTTVETLTGTTTLSFAYDAEHRLSAVADAFGNEVKLARDASGNAISVTAPFGQVTKLVYTPDNYLQSLTDPLGRVTTLAYDAGGLLTKLLDPRQGFTP